jgi:hypothetical protein
MSGYEERDAARDTDATQREVEAAWHGARDDADARGPGPRGDRPTRENREDARRLTERVIDRGREREEGRPEEREER